MVVEFGMSPVLGRLNYLKDSGPSGSTAAEMSWSEETAREIDLEVRRIIDEAQVKARNILQDHRETLDVIAARLIDQETIDAAELREILENAECRTGAAQRGEGGPGSES
jgi:cell division protease FtsH